MRPIAFLLLISLGCTISQQDWNTANDRDGDGYLTASNGGNDCDDADPTVHPGADEYCNGVDDDCDGDTDEDDALDAPTWYTDADGDGYGDPESSSEACTAPSGMVVQGDDCDDGDADEFPGALWNADNDGDGFGDPSDEQESCERPESYVADATDCDDDDTDQHPGADEYCNGEDDDCDGDTDEDDAFDVTTWYADTDSDSYGDASSTDLACDQPS